MLTRQRMIVHVVVGWMIMMIMSSVHVNGKMYSSKDAVVNLNPSNFQSNVIASSGVWFVEFYAPWCGHCKSLAPEWKRAARALEGMVHFGAVDADQHQSLGHQYGVQGFPTIKVFGADKSSPVDYQGERMAKALVDNAVSQVRKISKQRMNMRPDHDNHDNDNDDDGPSAKSKPKSKRAKIKPGKVVKLTDANFDRTVMQSNDIWMVEFYAPWCGHCKNLAPEWKLAAKQLKNSGVVLADVDATVHQTLASKFQIKGFPTIKYFMPGSTRASDAQEYPGARNAADITAFGLTLIEKAGGLVKPIVEFVSDAMLHEHCEDKSICVLVFLPHILDSKKNGRNAYIDTVTTVTTQVRGQPFRFGWVEAGSQTAWETSLGLTFGFPAIVAINFDKKRFAVQKGSFVSLAIKNFLDGLTNGRVSTKELPSSLPKFATVTPWDGKEPTIHHVDDDEDDEIMKELLKDEL